MVGRNATAYLPLDREQAHMKYEEAVLLPLYEQRATIERGGETKLFLDEHEKMTNFIKLFLEPIDELANASSPEPLL